MSQEWMTIQAYFGQPGSERSLATVGVEMNARIDTGAESTVVPRMVIDKVYGDAGYEYEWGRVKTITGTADIMIVPLVVGIKAGGDIIHAQVDCGVVSQSRLLIGNDVLSLLGLGVKIDYQNRQIQFERYSWRTFEDEVGAHYRTLGAVVKQNVNLGGFQIDMLVTERTQSGQQLRLAVECKFYKDPIGNRMVNDFARIVATLKTSGLIDRGVIVGYRGFSGGPDQHGERIFDIALSSDRASVDHREGGGYRGTSGPRG